jgi:hypothetical protein
MSSKVFSAQGQKVVRELKISTLKESSAKAIALQNFNQI